MFVFDVSHVLAPSASQAIKSKQTTLQIKIMSQSGIFVDFMAILYLLKDSAPPVSKTEFYLLIKQKIISGSLDAHKVMEILQNQGVKVNLLDLKRGDIRPGLAKLRNKGIRHFIVDIGQEYLKLFFEEAMKAGIVHEKSAFLSASLVRIFPN